MSDHISKLNLRPGDRVRVSYLEFPTWEPTNAIVTKIWIKFPYSEPPIRRECMQVRLDQHPFSEVLWFDPMDYFSFEIENPYVNLERLEGTSS